MKVYVTVCYDRHVDDDIRVHRTLEQAIAYVNKFVRRYSDREDWTWVREIHYGSGQNCYCGMSWPLYVRISNFEDGPCAHIEVTELK